MSTRQERALYLRSAGYSIREIARDMGVPRATVGDWLRGQGETRVISTCPRCGDSFLSTTTDARRRCPRCVGKLIYRDLIGEYRRRRAARRRRGVTA